MAPYREPANNTSGCGAGVAAAEGEVAIVASALGCDAAGGAADPQAVTSKRAIAEIGGVIGRGVRWRSPGSSGLFFPAGLSRPHLPPLHPRIPLPTPRPP